MILMVNDYPAVYIIDDLEFVRLEQLYYISREGDVYYRETPEGCLFELYLNDTTTLLEPRDTLKMVDNYQTEIYDDGETEKEIKVCLANAVCARRNGIYHTYIIYPTLNAYLCNNVGKTIIEIT
jgi:hypothetical protein